MSLLVSLQRLMAIASIVFLAFLIMVVVIYFCLPGPRTRATLLLLASSFFLLLFSPRLLWVIFLVIVLAYGFGILFDGLAVSLGPGKISLGSVRLRRALLIFAIVLIAAALLICKYAGFVSYLSLSALSAIGVSISSPSIKILVPIGISFWTFQALAYVIDVYKGKIAPEKNLLYFSTSVLFFPIVTMGPITPVHSLVNQLKVKHHFSYDTMRSALLLIGWGFFKKLVVADALAVFVGSVFDSPHKFSGRINGMMFFIAAIAFAIQLYTDFSGYTDIVRGAARLFGIELPLNFRAPYFARNVADFWRRWHMTLMDWLRNYVYFPLGGSRKGKLRTQLNVMVVFLISGFWHGAGLQYIAWGGINGLWQVASRVLKPYNEQVAHVIRLDRAPRVRHVLQVMLTCLLVTIAWVFFRANSLRDALYILPRMFMPTVHVITDGTVTAQGLNAYQLLAVMIAIAVVWVVDYLIVEKKIHLLSWILERPLVIRWAGYYVLIFAIVIFGHYGGTYNAADFIYYKF